MARSKPMARAAVLLALVFVASCLTAAAARGKVCGDCGGCKKKQCKFDDRCFYDKAAQSCQDVLPTNAGASKRGTGVKPPPRLVAPGGRSAAWLPRWRLVAS